jgi:hypothetical protein
MRGVAFTERPMPADFREIAPTLSLKAACAHWTCGDRAATRWYREAGLVPFQKHPKRLNLTSAPADFAKVAPTLTLRDLAKNYRVGNKRLHRWLKETGVDFKRLTQAEAARIRWKDHQKKEKRPQTFLLRRTTTETRDGAPDALAADELRKYAPCYRCDEIGRANPQGKFWRYGNVTLTPDEAIERAQRRAA